MFPSRIGFEPPAAHVHPKEQSRPCTLSVKMHWATIKGRALRLHAREHLPVVSGLCAGQKGMTAIMEVDRHLYRGSNSWAVGRWLEQVATKHVLGDGALLYWL